MFFIKRNLFRILCILLALVLLGLLILIFILNNKKNHPVEMDFGRYTKYSYSNFVVANGASVKLDSTTVNLGEEIIAYVELDPVNSTEYSDVVDSVQWVSENPEIATVNAGIIKGVSKGTTKININTKMTPSIFLASIEVTVKIPVERIVMAQELLELNIGDKYPFVALVLPEDASVPDLVWTSSNDKIATVSPTGEIEAKAVGEVTISASSMDNPEIIGNVKVTVKHVPVESIKLDVSDLKLQPGQTHTLVPTITPDNATYKDIAWETSNADIVKVNNGVVQAVGNGEAQIKATTDKGSKFITCNVTVSQETKHIIENVPYISTSSSGYASGHEIVSAAMLLRHSGYTVNVKDIADRIATGPAKYQEGTKWYGASPFDVFVGNPSSTYASGSWGCFAVPLVNSMRNYASSKVKNISGYAETTLFSYIDNKKPVIVWCTQGNSSLVNGVLWNCVDNNKNQTGYTFQEVIGKHCALLVGYDNELVYLHDPAINAYTTQPKDKFLANWKALYSQAIVIE